MSRGILGKKLDSLIVILDGPVNLTLLRQSPAAIVKGGPVVGVKPDDLIEIINRPEVIVQVHVGQTAAVVNHGR